MKLTPAGLMLTEIAPGIDVERDVMSQSDFALIVSDNLIEMPRNIFLPELIGLQLPVKERRHANA